MTALLFFALAPWMVRGFSAEPGILDAGTTYLRIIAWGYPFTAVSMLAGRILQGLGIGTPVLVLTVMRHPPDRGAAVVGPGLLVRQPGRRRCGRRSSSAAW